jgi:hypothetical protein
MAYVTADVIPVTGGEAPFKVVFKQGETVLVEWPVDTQAEGEEQIVEFIKDAADADDEDEDEDDDKAK